MFAGEWNVLSRPNNKVVGPNGVLMGTEGGAGIISPTALDGLALWLDAIDQNSLLASDGSVIEDGEAVALWSDKSGNSAENCLVLNGVAGNYASSPDSAAVSGPSELDIYAEIAPTNPASGASQYIVCQYLTAGDQRSWTFQLSATGSLVFATSPDGTSSVSIATSTAPWPYAAYTRAQVRVTWDSSDGDVIFYTRLNSSGSWIQLGAPRTAGTSPAFNSNGEVAIGSISGGAASMFSGSIYRAAFSKTINGAYVFDADFTSASKLATSFTESSSNAATVTINTTGATGARISGARDLYQGTVANRPVFLKYNGEKYGYIATTADYFSTPDSAALDVTSDTDLVFAGTAVDWTPSTVSILVDKANITGNQYSYRFYLDTSGNLNLAWSPDGTAASSVLATSTVATGFTDGNKGYVRAFLDVDDGGVYKVYFYTSSDGSTWSQLGTTIVGGGTTSIFASTTALAVGRRTDTAAQSFVGRVHLAQVWSGNSTAGGTLRAGFNAQDYTSGTTFTASTGETWTLNGGSHIVQRTGLYFDGSNDYLKSASFSLSNPETIHFIGEQVTWTDFDTLIDGAAGLGTGRLYQLSSSPNLVTAPGGVGFSGEELKAIKIYSSVLNGSSSSNKVNREVPTTGSLGATVMNGVYLGCRGDGAGGYSNVFVSELPIYSTAQDTATQDRVALYAGRKWKFAV